MGLLLGGGRQGCNCSCQWGVQGQEWQDRVTAATARCNSSGKLTSYAQAGVVAQEAKEAKAGKAAHAATSASRTTSARGSAVRVKGGDAGVEASIAIAIAHSARVLPAAGEHIQWTVSQQGCTLHTSLCVLQAYLLG